MAHDAVHVCHRSGWIPAIEALEEIAGSTLGNFPVMSARLLSGCWIRFANLAIMQPKLVQYFMQPIRLKPLFKRDWLTDQSTLYRAVLTPDQFTSRTHIYLLGQSSLAIRASGSVVTVPLSIGIRVRWDRIVIHRLGSP